jgi:hypothetical protein
MLILGRSIVMWLSFGERTDQAGIGRAAIRRQAWRKTDVVDLKDAVLPPDSLLSALNWSRGWRRSVRSQEAFFFQLNPHGVGHT